MFGIVVGATAPDLGDGVADFEIAVSTAQQCAQIVAFRREQAQVQLAFGGQADAAAIATERVSHAGDHADLAATVAIAPAFGGLARVVGGDGFAKAHQPQGRAVVRLPIANRFDAGIERGDRAGKWTIADLQFNDVFALGFELPGNDKDIEGDFAGKATGKLAESDGGIRRHERVSRDGRMQLSSSYEFLPLAA